MSIRLRLALTLLAISPALPTLHAQTPSQGLLQEIFAGIGGVSVSDLTNNPAFPNNPSSTNYLTVAFEAGIDVLDDYGQRVRGYVVPPATGNYTFWISSDDGSTLFLSTDEQPVNRRAIASVASWTASREWTKESTQASAPVRLESGRRYYIEALMKEGGGGDNLAVRWQLPNGAMEEPIPATRLLPFGISFTPPIITQQPTNATTMEGETATFRVAVSNLDPVSYQWQSNRINLPGATGNLLTLSPTPLSANGSLYRCILTNSLGATNTLEATLTVTPDNVPPRLAALQNIGPTTLTVIFSEPVQSPGSLTLANYSIDQNVTILGAAQTPNPTTISLTTSPMTLGLTYTLTVNQVTDRAVTPNPIAPNSQMTFRAVEYAPIDIGDPVLPGSASPSGNGYDVSGAGLDIGATSDQFHFEYAQRTGNFDLQVRLAGFTPTDLWAKAGLMARESLEPNARFTAAFATPASVGCFMMTRSTAGTAAALAGRFPANYPDTWLRLQRNGNLFTAFASYDGLSWTQLGTANLSLPSTLFVGTAVTSRNPTQTAVAQFRDYAPGSGSVGPAPTPGREPIGPSSRRTGLVFSEIMYRPANRADTNNLEFVEIYNGGFVFEDLTGFRLSGAIDFTFPTNTALPAGGLLVVAKSPQALLQTYSLNPALTPVLGPYDGALADEGDTLRLRDELDSVLLEVPYSNQSPWPLAADGAGHSLALAFPSYGEAHPQAWAPSELIGGSPGTLEPVRPNPYATLRINEFLAHTDDPVLDFIELYNHGNSPVNLSGCFLTDNPNTNKFRIPDGTTLPARGFLAYDQNELGFALDASGETLYLVSSNATRILDAVRFAGQQNGVATGRSPDGASTFRTLSAPTPNAPNAPFRLPEIVISEIMYNPITDDDRDEFVELYNRSGSPVNLSGWRFTDGISFRIPTNTTLPPGGYLVVAKDLAHLLPKYPNLSTANTIGDYDGALANSGERLVLSKPDQVVSTNEFDQLVTNTIWIAVCEVPYGTGGRWPELADGGGSSLELVDLDADSLRAPNWAASDESAKAPWTTVEFTGTMDNGNNAYPPDFQMGVLGAGSCLVDDVEVFTPGGPNRLSNPNFNSSLASWVFQGNHRYATHQSSGGVSGGCLRLAAAGRVDTGANRIYSTLSSRSGLQNGATVTLRAKVRWLSGWPEFLLRLRGNWIEAPGRLLLPPNLGTPGAPNSRALANAGPAIFDVSHSPTLPASGQTITVSARTSDPDTLSRLDLYYRVDGTASFSVTTMVDNGSNGDAVAGDGLYTATLPARSANTLVSFYLAANDPLGGAARFPANAPTNECLVRWGESESRSTLPNYRLWQRQADVNTLYSREPLANDNLDGTFVYGDARVIYNARLRAKGSPWHSGSIGSDWVFSFPDDNQFLGGRDMAVVTIGNLGSDDSGQREQAAYWILRKLQNPYLHRRYVRFLWNGSQAYPMHEDTQEPTGEYLDQWFPSDNNGDLHKIEDWFEFADDARNFSPTDATLQRFTTTGGQLKLARYRWDWRRRAVQDSANNFTNLLNLVEAANLNTSDYTRQLENLADLEQWMRCFMAQHIVGNWDAYGYNRGKNCYAYKPTNGRWTMIAWDIDFVLGSGSDGPSTDIFGTNDPTISRMYNHPPFLRACWRAIQDACDGPLRSDRIGPLLDAKWKEFQANNLSYANPNATKSWIESRRNYLLNRLASVAFDFAITTANGNNFSTNRNLATLTGTAPIPVKFIEVNGIPYPITWTTVSSWSLSVPLAAGPNALTLQGRDLRGQPVPHSTRTITITYTGADQLPQDYVVINEIHYHAATSQTGFVELHNTSTLATFNLSNWRLDGIGYTFPEGTLLPPGAYLVVAANPTEFAKLYGSSILPLGPFPGNLDNGGETLRLLQPGPNPDEETLIDIVRYDDDPPWPASADGLGPSLQLIDPSKDNWRPANWTTTTTNATLRTTPGTVNAVRTTLPPFPTLWINELQPENLSGPLDQAGDRDPWIELYNPGPNAASLDGLYLSDSFTNLTRYAFPPGLSIPPGQFLLVVTDGEPAESSPSEPHTNFRLPPSSGQIALSRLQSGQPAALDSLAYNLLSPGRSYGYFPDGHPASRRVFQIPTPGTPNDLTSLPTLVRINEWMSANTRSAADPADGDYDDWFELYNAGAETVDLTGFTLTDNLTNTTKFTIPAGTLIPPDGFLVVWADEEPNQNGRTPDLHTNFKLSADGESIGLFAPDASLVDAITFGPQNDDVSHGRYPDGDPTNTELLQLPSPGQPNIFNTTNRAPSLAAIDPQTVPEGTLLSFTAQASDPDADQSLVFTLDPGAPAAASIEPESGLFAWTPTESDGPGAYPVSIRVTDNGTPPRRATTAFVVTVTEVNRPPTLDPLANLTINEGSLVNFQATASDPDLPPHALSFSLTPNAPDGAAIDPVTGAFSWTPSETQGGATYGIDVVVTDDGTPPLATTNSVQITVNKFDNPPRLQAVPSQTIDELAPFSLTFVAIDPDLPPAALVYSLEGEVPSGLAFDPNLGTLHWTPSETQGPSSYLLTVRATETTGLQQSDSVSFTLDVREVNLAPTLDPIPDLTAREGQLITLTNHASDPDLPAQSLSWSLDPGAPKGATIDPASGVFLWPIDPDYGAATNSITVRASDGGSPNLDAAQSFTVIVQPVNHLAINEIMYAPATPNADYIELFNHSKVTPATLDGLRLDPLNLTFPPNSTLPPGAYGVVVRNRAAFTTAYGPTPTILAESTPFLNPAGDTISLVRPGPTPDADELLDRVQFSSQLPWPTNAATGGASLQLVDPRHDNTRPWNWAVGDRLVTNLPVNFLAITNSWRYNQTNTDLGSDWTAPSYNDTAWPSGPGLLYVESSALPAPKNTLLTLGPPTFYFRTRFTFNGNPTGATLILNTVLDDGAILHLNGQPVFRLGMDEGPASFASFANRVVDNASFEGPFRVPVTNLLRGDNVLAVEVHQVNAGSSDVAWGLSLDIEELKPAAYTPGAENSVRADLPPAPALTLNEVLPANTAGLTDSAGDPDPWIELHNASPQAVALDGWTLTDNYSNLSQWTFPNGTLVPAHGYLLVWADAEPSESSPAEPHTSFRLHPTTGQLALSRPQNGQPAVIDFLEYLNASPNQASGARTDGDLFNRGPLSQPSPNAPNTNLPANQPPALDPVANLQIPAGSSVQFTLSASDPDPNQTLTFSLLPGAPPTASLHPTSGLFTWPIPTDQPAGDYPFTAQVTDNGLPPASAQTTFLITVQAVLPPDPPLRSLPQLDDSHRVTLTWSSLPTRRYRVEFKHDLADPDWITLIELVATDTQTTASDPNTPQQPYRLYRVLLLP